MKPRRRATSGGARTTERDHDAVSAFDAHIVSQDHATYSATAHGVWRDVLSRNAWILEHKGEWIHPAYVEGLRALALPDRIPRIEELNERLSPTGWRTVCVDGYIPTAAYVGLMAASIFPVSRVIRRPEHIDYAPAPDMVHDILGHLPMLFSPEHRDFLRRLATVMGRARPNTLDGEYYAANRHMAELKSDPASSPAEVARAEARVLEVHKSLGKAASELTHLARMYLWSVEFGLVGDTERFLVHGAALLSSPTELRALCEKRIRRVPYSLDVVNHDIAFSDLQTRYFVARDFAHLDEVLEAYEVRMSSNGEVRTSEIREIRPTLGVVRRGNA